MHISFVDKPAEVYSAYEGCCFPPFAYLFYLFVNRILPTDGDPSMNEYRMIPATTILYFCGVAFCMMVIALFVYEALENKKAQALLACALILFSEPFFAGAIERGNSVLLTLVLLLGFLYCKDSEKPLLREVALFLLVAAACFKIYPAVFGFLYLREKRYREFIRLVIYGAILFFVPFAFFGGVRGLLALLSNLKNVGAKPTTDIYTISGCLQWLWSRLASSQEIPLSVQRAGKILSVVYLLAALVCTWFEKEEWKRFLYLGSLMIIFTNSSYPYTTIYLLLPLLSFLRHHADGKSAPESFYGLCFGLIFTVLMIPDGRIIALFGKSFAFLLRYFTLYPMLLAAMAGTALSCYNQRSVGIKR